jgi:Spy/CpxP family protein refolding chaperone
MLKLLAGITMLGALLCAQSPQPPVQATGQTTTERVNRTGGPGRGPRPWWDSEVAKNANLSEAQQKQIAQTQHEFRPRMREVQRAVNQADAEVAAAFNEEPVDQAKANEAINKLATAHAELTKAVSQLELKLRTILTAQQWQEMRHPRPWPDRAGPRRRSPTSTSPATTNQK